MVPAGFVFVAGIKNGISRDLAGNIKEEGEEDEEEEEKEEVKEEDFKGFHSNMSEAQGTFENQCLNAMHCDTILYYVNSEEICCVTYYIKLI